MSDGAQGFGLGLIGFVVAVVLVCFSAFFLARSGNRYVKNARNHAASGR